MSDYLKVAYDRAVDQVKKAYAPYSRFQVSSVLKFKGHDELYSGVNVENSSYGAAICAERTALCSAISSLGPDNLKLEFVLVLTEGDEVVSPCGLCLQLLSEFVDKETRVYRCTYAHQDSKGLLFSEFLPHAFSREKFLKAHKDNKL